MCRLAGRAVHGTAAQDYPNPPIRPQGGAGYHTERFAASKPCVLFLLMPHLVFANIVERLMGRLQSGTRSKLRIGWFYPHEQTSELRRP